MWTTTDVQNETETRVRTLSSTVVQSVTATTVVSEVVTATTTNLRQVKETALMDCLNTVSLVSELDRGALSSPIIVQGPVEPDDACSSSTQLREGGEANRSVCSRTHLHTPDDEG